MRLLLCGRDGKCLETAEVPAPDGPPTFEIIVSQERIYMRWPDGSYREAIAYQVLE